MSKGLTETAATLHREGSLDTSAIMKPVCTYQPFTYRSPATTGVSYIDNDYIYYIFLLLILCLIYLEYDNSVIKIGYI